MTNVVWASETLDLGSSVIQYSLLTYARVWPLPQLDTTTVARFQKWPPPGWLAPPSVADFGSSDAEADKTAQLPFVQSESVLASWKALGRPLKVWLHDMDRTADREMLTFLGRKTGAPPARELRKPPCTNSSGDCSTRNCRRALAVDASARFDRDKRFLYFCPACRNSQWNPFSYRIPR
jgi:hypothetical protein